MTCCGLDGITLLNAMLCVLILIAGCVAYIATGDNKPFHIGVAFGLFAVSHVIDLMGIQKLFEPTVMLVRVFGYLIVLFTILRMRAKA